MYCGRSTAGGVGMLQAQQGGEDSDDCHDGMPHMLPNGGRWRCLATSFVCMTCSVAQCRRWGDLCRRRLCGGTDCSRCMCGGGRRELHIDQVVAVVQPDVLH